MSHKINLVRVLTAATGNSTPIVLGAAYSQLFMLPSEAGAMDGRTYTYNIVDGNNWEIGRGVYTASGTTLSRNVIVSRISGTLGTSRIMLSGTAQVRFVDAAEDMDGVRGTRPVTGTTDTLNNSDLGFVVTYSNASAIAVSVAQAGTSGLFLDGWATYVKNKGAGVVTITPATSTIALQSTLQLKQNQGALIWSDGTNYDAFIFRGDIGTIGTAAAHAEDDFVRSDASQSKTAAQQKQARVNSGVDDRNILINSDFRINQRAYTSAAALASGVYGHDRWKAGASGGDYSFTQLASSTQITIASGKTLIQVVEDKNIEGGTYVLSWTGTAQGRAGVNSATPSGSYAASPLIISSQTAGAVMSVEFNTGTLGKVKLEVGSVATPFVMTDITQEFAKALRYAWIDSTPSWLFYEGISSSVSGNNVTGTVTCPVPMRTTPTVTLPSWSLGGNGTPSVVGATNFCFNIRSTSTSAAGSRMYMLYGGGSLSAIAEL
jgi:hypothetical protein